MSSEVQRQLFEDLNYLNQRELRGVCRRFEIPYRISLELPGGGTRTTSQDDRKGVILDRLKHFLTTGERRGPTVLSAEAAGPAEPPAELSPSDPVHYRWYKRDNAAVLDLLRDLTGGSFRDGQRARELLMDHWTAGRAPSFEDFATEWLESEQRGESLVAPEYAYLSDLRDGHVGEDWKAVRTRRAARAVDALERR